MRRINSLKWIVRLIRIAAALAAAVHIYFRELTDNLIVTLDYEDNDGYAIRGYNDWEGYTSDVFKWRVTVDGNIYDRATEEWLLYR